MRIIAGKYKRRLISWPDENSIRPTKDRIREAMFSSLGNIDNFVALDLYSGSGSLGLEALSRGAKKVYFVDHGITAIKTTKANIQSLNIPSSDYEILSKEDTSAIEDFIKKGISFDLIFLDPPYKEGKYLELINTFIKNNLLSAKGIVVVECDHKIDFSSLETFSNKEYKYGEIFVYILRK